MLVLSVDRKQFFVDAVQFFVGRLQFFVGSNQFFIGRLQLFVAGLHFFDGCLQDFSAVSQFEFKLCQLIFGYIADLNRFGWTRQLSGICLFGFLLERHHEFLWLKPRR